MSTAESIKRRAIRIEQHRKHPLYLFSLTARELLQIADISRVSRDDAGHLIGYQRPEVKRHVRNIVDYLNGTSVLFPNSIILALSSVCRFTEIRGPKVDKGPSMAGTLAIPLPKEGRPRPAWIVDGQQRALALSRIKDQDFPVPTNAFVADHVDLQRDQFLRINNTKPLPLTIITELLPEVDTLLPSHLQIRKAPAALCDLLSRDPESPFYGLIRRSSMAPAVRRKAVIADTVLVRMLQERLTQSSGCLFPYRNMATNETDFHGIRLLLLTYWRAVRDVFKESWGLTPTKSRLMHSVGILAMGRLMDRIMSGVSSPDAKAERHVRAALRRIKPMCRWTEGYWDDLDGIAWNKLQNVPNHIQLLSNALIRAYINSRSTAA